MWWAVCALPLVAEASRRGAPSRGPRGWGFAGAYVVMQVGRSLFMVWALAGRSPGNFRNFQRVTLWFVLSAAFWLAGAVVGPSERLTLWTLALLLDYASPALGFKYFT